VNRCYAAKLISAVFFAVLLFAVALPALAMPRTPTAAISTTTSPGELVSDRFGVCSSMIYQHAGVGDVFPAEGTDMHAQFDAMQTAGIKWIRCTFPWNEMEPGDTEGNWSFDGRDLGAFGDANHDLVLDLAQAHGIKVLGILSGTPSWANGGNWASVPPTNPTEPDLEPDPEFMAAWMDYVNTVCSRYAGRVDAWEIWNEQNTLTFWLLTYPPQPTLDQYTDSYVDLLIPTSDAIRAIDPSAKIVLGGVAGLGENYLEPEGDEDFYFIRECLERNAGDYVDAVAYHPYSAEVLGWSKPEEAQMRGYIQALRDIIDSFNPADPIEIWINEFGWKGWDVDSKARQARYVLRELITYADTTVAKADMIMYYKLWDEGGSDDYFGLLNNDFTAKAAYDYFKCFESVFGPTFPFDPSYIDCTCTNPAALEAHFFQEPSGDLAMAFWKSDNTADNLTLYINEPSFADPVQVNPADCQPRTPDFSRDPNGNITVNVSIGDTPVIITAEAAGENPYVFSMAPCFGFVDTTVTVTELKGEGFASGATVALEGDSATIEADSVDVISGGQIACQFSLNGVPLGEYDVVVTNPDLNEARLEAGFRVLDPLFHISSITPNQGATGFPADNLNLKGRGFQSGAQVKLLDGTFEKYATSVTFVSETQLTCSFDLTGVTAGIYAVVVENPGGSETSLRCFEVVADPSQCGSGSAASVLVLAAAMGILSLLGSSPARRRWFSRKR
jgi:hypothetical protein